MTRAVRLFKRSFSLLFLAGMMFVLSACSSAEASKQNNEYYEQLSKCTDTFLMKNRELKEISNSWSYKDKASTEKYINKPIDKFNHYIDALRYGIQGIERRKLQTLNKSTLKL